MPVVETGHERIRVGGDLAKGEEQQMMDKLNQEAPLRHP